MNNGAVIEGSPVHRNMLALAQRMNELEAKYEDTIKMQERAINSLSNQVNNLNTQLQLLVAGNYSNGPTP